MRAQVEAAGAGPRSRRLLRWTRLIVYWSLPPLLLYLVFRRIELVQLRSLLGRTDLRLVSAGLLLIGLVVVAGALRWYFLVRHYECASPTIGSSIGDYWRSLAVGVLVPGSLGSDAYRVMAVGRERGRYLRSAFIVGVEKLAALASCAVLIASLYPFLAPHHLPASVVALVRAVYWLLMLGVLLGFPLLLVRRHEWVQRLANSFNRQIETLAMKVTPRSASVGPEGASSLQPGRAGVDLMVSVLSMAVWIPALALSLAVHFLSAIQAQVFFLAVGHHVPFSVNLFVTPVLFLLLILPISFGGIGLREGAFVVLYGAFGVPPETALVVSLCSWLAVLLSNGVGALSFLAGRRQLRAGRELASAANPQDDNS